MFTKSLTAMALLGGLAVPAVAAHAAPASTDAAGVKLAWVGGKVQITWTEDAAAANTISLERPGMANKQIGTTTAAGANQLLVDPSVLEPTHDPAATAKILVSGGGADARSSAFDRYIRGAEQFGAGITNGNVLNWAANPDGATDATPNDPLDVQQVKYIPRLVLAGCKVVELPATAAPNGQVPNQNQPFNLKVYTASEWGESFLGARKLRTSAITMTAPASTTFGSSIGVTGSVSLRQIAESGSTCVNADDPSKGDVQISLQARNDSTSPWYSVGVVRTNAQGKYSFPVANPGAREYRTAVNPGPAVNGEVQYPSITASKQVRATTSLQSAKFVKPVITFGEKANAVIWVKPEGSQIAVLQYKTPSGTWQHVVTRNLSYGKAESTPFGFTQRGVTPFRWWIAGVTTRTGLPVDPIFTPTFNLTVN